MRTCLALLLTLTAAIAAEPLERPWTHDVIYFALTDRFFDGDAANNVPAGSDPALYDKTQQDIGKYHGGDLRGLELAMQRGYFTDLGVTALWISPPVRNAWNSLHDLGGSKTGYHGYWAQDFLDIDPHLTSAASLDGKAYDDSRDGRMQHYKDFVARAHAAGLKVIQDIVLNHTGPVFYYDANGNGQFDTEDRAEWIQPYRADGFHGNAKWADVPKWNLRKTEPSGPQTILGREVKTTGALSDLEAYGRKGFSDDSLGKSDGTEHVCDFFALRDVWTMPGSAHFEQLVAEFVEIYAFYLEEIGVDGFRIDTVKHVHRTFWDAFTARLRERVGPERAKRLLLFGEVYDGNPTVVGKYTYRKDWPGNPGPALDSLLNFPLCFAVREYLRPVIGPFGKAGALEQMWRDVGGAATDPKRPKFNQKRGTDGLNARQKMVNFIENHDGLNRFRVPPINEKQNILANALAILSEGIPCLYYGTEAGLADAKGKLSQDSESGRFTLIPAGKPENLDHIRTTTSYQSLKSIIALRQQLPALREGLARSIWADSPQDDADDGVMAFIRYLPADRASEDDDAAEAADDAEAVVVAINASERPRATSAKGYRMAIVARGKPLLPEGGKLVRQPVPGLDSGPLREQTIDVPLIKDKPQVELVLNPQTVNVYRVRK